MDSVSRYTTKQTPATMRPDWRLPLTPTCPEHDEPMNPVCHNTGDGWWWGWECDALGCLHIIEEPVDFDWPFVEDRARASDWERLGIQVR